MHEFRSCFHAECLGFIRVAIAEAFRTTAHEIAAVLKEVCTEGHADLAQIWSALEPIERQQFQELLAPPPITRDDRQAYQGGVRLSISGCGSGYSKQFGRCDRRRKTHSSRGCGSCRRGRICPFSVAYEFSWDSMKRHNFAGNCIILHISKLMKAHKNS